MLHLRTKFWLSFGLIYKIPPNSIAYFPERQHLYWHLHIPIDLTFNFLEFSHWKLHALATKPTGAFGSWPKPLSHSAHNHNWQQLHLPRVSFHHPWYLGPRATQTTFDGVSTTWNSLTEAVHGSRNRMDDPACGCEVFGELKACYQPSVCLHAYQRRARSANLINMLVICAKLHFPFNRVRVNGS